MVVMEAVMVRLPFCASIGHGSVLDTLVESNVPVKTFGSETVKAIITYKWRKFAQRQIYTKAILYMTFVLLFTAYAIILRCVWHGCGWGSAVPSPICCVV